MVGLEITMRSIIKSDDLQYAGETILENAGDLVHTSGARTCTIFAYADVLKHFCYFVALWVALRRYLVADGPHDDTWVVAEVM